MKYEKIYDCDGFVDGYKYGEYYIMKCYTCGSHYEWGINKDGTTHYAICEFDKEVENGNVILCESLKHAKETLKKLVNC